MGFTPIFRASLAMSLDGYIADANGDVDWLNDYFSPELDWEAFAGRFGATVVGRRTHDASVKKGIPVGGDGYVVLTHIRLAACAHSMASSTI